MFTMATGIKHENSYLIKFYKCWQLCGNYIIVLINYLITVLFLNFLLSYLAFQINHCFLFVPGIIGVVAFVHVFKLNSIHLTSLPHIKWIRNDFLFGALLLITKGLPPSWLYLFATEINTFTQANLLPV